MATDPKYFGTVTITHPLGSNVFDDAVACPDERGGIYVKDRQDRPVGIFTQYYSVTISHAKEDA